jgi:hypothetical protein
VKKIRTILQKHYKTVLRGRQLTDKEIADEIDNLKRKYKNAILDDIDERLYSQIQPYLS